MILCLCTGDSSGGRTKSLSCSEGGIGSDSGVVVSSAAEIFAGTTKDRGSRVFACQSLAANANCASPECGQLRRHFQTALKI